VRADLDPPPTALIGRPLSGIGIAAMTLEARGNPFSPAPTTHSSTSVSITLDGLYPQLRVDTLAALEAGGQLIAAQVRSVTVARVPAPITTEQTPQLIVAQPKEPEPQPAIPATRVRLDLGLPAPSGWQSGFLLRFNPIDGGQLTAPAKIRIALADLAPSAALEGPVEPLGDIPGPSRVLAKGAEDEGPEIAGGITAGAGGVGLLAPDAGALPFRPLRTPIEFYGNVAETTRGESVTHEILGSADAAQAFQQMALKKKPLTYVLDPSAPDGVRAELSVWVNGILWREIPSFFDASPEDEVYVVRHDEDQTARIVFGDGTRGARPRSGIGNVTASYRFGAGAAKPPAAALSQIARPVKGLKTVVNPLPARGGADAESFETLRVAAPRSALTLGRAVSVADFEALARGFPGIVNAAAAWAFDGRLQRPTVKVWIIATGGDPSQALRAQLRRSADPEVPIMVAPATAVPVALGVALEIDGRHDPATVRQEARAALLDEKTGLLAPANAAIGRPLFRSALTARLLAVPGVLGATVSIAGAPAPAAFLPGEGGYLDAADALVE